MENLKELLKAIEEADDVEVHKFDSIEESPAEDELPVDVLIFEAGITEAVRRLLKNHNDYDIIKYVRSILDVEYEGEKKDE